METRALAPLVRAFVDGWARDHLDLAAPLGHGSGIRRNALGQLGGNDALSGVRILHERTRLSDPYERGVSERQIRNIMRGRSRVTELRVADALLVASGQDDALRDGTLGVFPNPRAAPAERAGCCGGSLTGALPA